MHGHIEIIKARLRGQRPGFVFLNDYPCKTDWFEFAEHATVCTSGDSLSNLDFRFLAGCKVSISATNESRAKALFAMAKEAGATTVAACHMQAGVKPWQQSGWTEVYHKPVAIPQVLESING